VTLKKKHLLVHAQARSNPNASTKYTSEHILFVQKDHFAILQETTLTICHPIGDVAGAKALLKSKYCNKIYFGTRSKSGLTADELARECGQKVRLSFFSPLVHTGVFFHSAHD